MFGLRDSDIKLIVEALHGHEDVEEAIIFGSRAMGNYKPGSDVDIALKGDLSSRTLNDVAAELNEHLPLPYKFDVIDYAALPRGALTEHIDHFGKTVFRRKI